jgi:FkbM family methyltransferase
MSERVVDRMARGVFSLVWKSISSLVWSAPFIRTVGVVMSVFPSIGSYRVTYKGSSMYAASMDRFAALLLWKYGVLEGYELQVAQSLIRPGMYIVDVGSNVGFHALEFARWTGASGHVDAYEPAPENYAVLERNIGASGLGNIIPFEMAISDQAGETTMYLSPAHRGDHRILASSDARSSIRVKTATLDQRYALRGRPVDFVKIDVQGAEYLVLAGMRQLLSANPDVIVFVEFSPELITGSGHSSDDFLALLASLGRRIQLIDHRAKQCIDCDVETLRRRAATARQLDLILSRR